MSIVRTVKQNPEGLIAKAYSFAEKVHAGQKRRTGEPYFNHVLATAEIVMSWNLDEPTVAAALLHDVLEDGGISPENLQLNFGKEVFDLVDGVTKIGHVKYRGAEAKADNLRELILAISGDLRVVLIKLADRLHNMRTLSALPRDKQKRIALETDEIYAPLAYRLGMHRLTSELQDLAFPYIQPEEHRSLAKIITSAVVAENNRYLEKVRHLLGKLLADSHIQPIQMEYRVKALGSLYKKMQHYGYTLEQVYDFLAMRVIVSNVAECYAALGVIHAAWTPVPGRIKDFIAAPKPNGYRSLQTTVIGPDNKILEIQVRTSEMHEENEYGIAAHFLYKSRDRSSESLDKAEAKRAETELHWVQQLKDWRERISNSDSDSEEILEAMKIDFFRDRIFVTTPKGEVLDLPAGSTPIDFAYRIHSDLGNSTASARVNGKQISLDHELHSGDLVEIITQKGKKPSEDWLNFARTAVARDHIRSALRKKKTGSLSIIRAIRTEFKITAKDRIGLIKDITSVIAKAKINILNTITSNSFDPKSHVLRLVCELPSHPMAETLVSKIRQVKGVQEVSYKHE